MTQLYDVTITVPGSSGPVTMLQETSCEVAETATTYTVTKSVTVGGTTWVVTTTVDRCPGMVCKKVPTSS